MQHLTPKTLTQFEDDVTESESLICGTLALRAIEDATFRQDIRRNLKRAMELRSLTLPDGLRHRLEYLIRESEKKGERRPFRDGDVLRCSVGY